ncbi:MAG TPA: alpha/beta fold hydrolase [Bauldia sp.]|nr:alpha/beta fold hydrolase [Bauldia sp.]
MRDGYAEVEGGRLWHRVDGSGPRVLFIPGYTLDLTMWDLQVEALRDRFTCIRFDPRGAGRSPPPTGPYTYIADVEALLSHLGIERAHLVGFSLGAAIALDFTLAHPKKVRSLTLIDASAVGGYPWPDRLKPAFAEISRLAAAGDIAAAKRAWLGHPWFAPALERPDSARRLRAIFDTYSGWHLANRNPASMGTPPAFARLAEIAVPTLVIAGDRDLDFYNLPLADALAAGIPGARREIIPGAGHMSNLEAPEAVNRLLAGFLNSHSGHAAV